MSRRGCPNPGDTARKLGGVMIRGPAFLGAALGISLAAASSAVAASVPDLRHQGPRLGPRCRNGPGRRLRLREAWLYATRRSSRTTTPARRSRRPRCSRCASSSPTGTRNVSITSTFAVPRARCRRQQLPARRRDVHARDVAQASGRGDGRAQGSSRPAAVHTGAAAARARARLPRLDPGHGPKRRPPGGQRRRARGLRAGRRLAGGRLRLGRSRR